MNSPNHHWWAQSLAVIAGVATTLQSRVNGELAVQISSGWQAAVVSFSVGLLAVLLYAMLSSKVRNGLRNTLAAIRRKELQPWQIAGGTIGAMFVAVQSMTVPMLGVAIFTIAVVGAQTSASIVVDKWGVGPQGRIQPTIRRVIAATIAVVAIVIAVSDRIATGEITFWAIVAALIVGAAVAFQHSINGHVSRAAENPVTTAVFNFSFGAATLWLIFAILMFAGVLDWQPLPLAQLYLFSGGLLGLLFIVIAAHVIVHLGSLKFTLGSVAGQLLGAVSLDLLVPTSASVVTGQLLTGVVMTAAAVVLANLRGSSAKVKS